MVAQERKLFYELVNFESTSDFGALLDSCRTLLSHYISQITPSVQYFEYNANVLDKFLLDDNQQVQEQYTRYVDEDPSPRSREDMITYITQLTPAKFVDGAWVQAIAKAQNLNASLDGSSLRASMVNDLFNIYVEELGEGTVEMNHIAIWQQLLSSLGISLPDMSAHAFISDARLWDSSFVTAVIQLALGFLGSSFLPEILGYNMGFEQLPLHLLTTVDELQKLGIDPYYFQLHISIDNLASGHGAVAANAVKKYMDDAITRFGKQKADEHWRRILNGFYLNNVNPMKDDLEKHYSSKRENNGNLEDRMIQMLKQKAPYAHKMHANKEIGGCPINKWLSPTSSDQQWKEFLDVFSSSHWINTKDPINSPFLTDICGFGGAMFHIFTRDELLLISEWIQRGHAGSTPPASERLNGSSKDNIILSVRNSETNNQSDTTSKLAYSMADLISSKVTRAKAAHNNRRLTDENGRVLLVNEWLQMDDKWAALGALRNTYQLHKVIEGKGDKSIEDTLMENKFYKSVANGSMKRYFTPSEVDTIRQWIVAKAPIPDIPFSISPVSSPSSAHTPISSDSHNSSNSSFSSNNDTPRSTSPVPLSPPSSVATDLPQSFISNVCPFASKSAGLPTSLKSEIEPINSSTLFYQLINIESFPQAFSQAQTHLTTHFPISISPRSQRINESDQLNNNVERIKNTVQKCQSLQQLGYVAKSFSLLFFMEGMCLQNLNMAGFHHTHINSILMKIFMNIWGYEDPLKNHFHNYNNVLKSLRVHIPPITSSFVSDCGFSQHAIDIAVLQLSSSMFPRSYFPEIIAMLEWSLMINKTILECITTRSKVLGGYPLDPVQSMGRMKEYDENIQLCKQAKLYYTDTTQQEGSTTDASRFSLAFQKMCQMSNNLFDQFQPTECKIKSMAAVE